MTYKETLLFIAQSLSNELDEKFQKKSLLENYLRNIDWDKIIIVSTKHNVLPALYVSLKKLKATKFLEKDLLKYMRFIYKINLERNKQIIKQAKEINNLLLKNHIRPIFLKGVGNLIQELYNDIGERMVGDIDFICSKDEYNRAVDILLNNGYYHFSNEKYKYPLFRHYPRLIKKNRIAAVEIHKELTKKEYSNEFNYESISDELNKINDTYVLSFKNQMILTIISHQINDYGIFYKTINLRNAYDIFLLSKKIKRKIRLQKYRKLKNPINLYIAVCCQIFKKINQNYFEENKKTKIYLSNFESLITNDKKRKFLKFFKYKFLYINGKLKNIYLSFYDKEIRDWLIGRIKYKVLGKY